MPTLKVDVEDLRFAEKHSEADLPERLRTDTAPRFAGISYCDAERFVQSELRGNKVISLFSGAGGLDIGLEMAGFETAVCVEHDDDCRETLSFNRPGWKPALGDVSEAPGDIRNITAEEILSVAGLARGEAALVVGGPPCQPFSNIGKKLGAADERNGDLSRHFVRIVTECLPHAFIFENVAGFHQGKHSETLNYVLDEAARAGYRTTPVIANSADYGVPQQRRRFLILGFRGDHAPSLPLPTYFRDKAAMASLREDVVRPDWRYRPWVTVAEAFAAIPPSHRNRSDHALMNISPVVRQRMACLKQGENFKALPMDMRPNCWKNGKHQGQDTFGRLRADRPSVTVRTAAYNPTKGMYIHPYEDRGLSSHEMAALQSFPTDWVFRCKGSDKVTLVGVGKQIGNAVPPLMARAFGLALKAELLGAEHDTP